MQWLAGIALTLVVFAAAGCTADATQAQRDASIAAMRRDGAPVDALRGHLRDRTVIVLSGASIYEGSRDDGSQHLTILGRFAFGTGSLLSDDGYVLTAAHCVEDHEPCYVIFRHKNRFPFVRARRIWVGDANDKTRDVAVLKIDFREKLSAFEWADDHDLMTGAPVMLAGHREGDDRFLLTLAAGKVIDANLRETTGDGPPVRAVAVDIPARRGDSGGPLLTADGRLIGIMRGWESPLLGLAKKRIALRPEPAWIDQIIARDRASRAQPSTSAAKRLATLEGR
jgi:S1-C subfamily serine protease